MTQFFCHVWFRLVISFFFTGQKSYLSIKLSTEGANVELKTVQILDMDNHKILEVPVKVMDKIEQFYITEPIDVPNHMFKIAVMQTLCKQLHAHL